MKKAFFLFFLVIYSFSYGQETSVIQGKILDGELFNEPLLMATVSIKNTTVSTHTNFRGNFEFNDITPGSYKILVQFLGYDSIELPITVRSGENVEILETLHARSLALPATSDVTSVERERGFVPTKYAEKR